ncbi:MAG: hypothetical protein IKA36_04135 [Clostridia bacterium]|nr:hypothetical protein [Clostridia bacterium]
MLVYRSQIIHTGGVYDKSTCLHSVVVNSSVYAIIDVLQEEDILPQIQCFEPIKKGKGMFPSEFIFTVSDEWLEKFCKVLTEYSEHKYTYHPENSYVLRSAVEGRTAITLSIEEAFVNDLPQAIAYKAIH